MKTITLLIAFVTASAALVVPPPSNGISDILLKTRDDGQQLTNPDKEDPYTDAITGDSIEKSRVLSGVGPQEANDRHFDWDESCTDEKQRRKILIAFNVMQELTKRASDNVQQLKDNFPHPRTPEMGVKIDKDNRKFIAQTDPAYTQMFRAWDSYVDNVKGSFDKVLGNVKNFPGRSSAGDGALRFICNADNHVKSGSDLGGSPLCGDANDKSTRAQAITHVPQDVEGGNIEQKYSFTKSSSITFCPAFFDDIEFPNLEDVIAIHQTDVLTLDQVDCAERILLHEYMHLPWVDNLVPNVDYIGYAKVAQHSSTAGSWQQVASLPDAFAWYTLYSYFNNVAGGCGDAWPPGEKKPIVIA